MADQHGSSASSAAATPEGWCADRLSRLAAELSTGGSTAFLIVDDAQAIFHWGFPAQRSSVASVRKSLAGLLYGIAVDRGLIRLDETLAEIGIDDIGGLTAQERGATVFDLLRSRSGVYHPSVYDTERGRPPRGAHAPGAHWFYNNWDFNALGTIFERRTGLGLFQAFDDWLAVPLGMQDFSVEECRFERGPQSIHPVYKMRLSARDLARIGWLCLDGGRWQGQQLVPEAWICRSVRQHSDLGSGRGYGLLWWTAEANAPGDAMSVDEPISYASGAGGQYVVLLAESRLVIVHRAARVDFGITHARMGELLRLALSARRQPG